MLPDLVASPGDVPAVPCGEFGDGGVLVVPLVVPVAPLTAPLLSDDPMPVPVVLLVDPLVDPLPAMPPVPVVDEPAVPVSLPVDVVDDGLAIDELPVVVVLEGFDIELSVFGWSDLLQAPSAATVAMIATILIERFMCAPRLMG